MKYYAAVPLVCLALGFVLILVAAPVVAAQQTTNNPTAALSPIQDPPSGEKTSAPPNWRIQRANLEQEFTRDLDAICDWCRANGIPQQVAVTQALKIERDTGRQYIFLPTTKRMPQPQPGSGLLGTWLEKVNAARQAHAQRVLELARQAADAEAGATAYQLLHEVIYYNRDHEEAREILGHRLRDEQWQVASDSINVRPGSQPHSLFNWPAKSYLVVRTPHFVIDSVANEERTRYLAQQLETWHTIWRQLFFEYWSNRKVVSRWMSGSSSARPSHRTSNRFKVVFFPNKESYVAALNERVRGALAISSGYYSSSEQVAFFYDGDQRDEENWRHELNHQLFRETGRAPDTAFDNAYFWVDEAVATYFESVCDMGEYVTVGGFDSRRMQFARLWRLVQGYYVPLEQLSAIGRGEFQLRADMKPLYSQGAGIMNMLMNDHHGADEQATVEFLRLVYKGRLRANSFEKIIGKPYEQFDERYPEFLKVDTETVAQFLLKPESKNELSVAGAGLKQPAYDAIGKCTQLNWLDLSANRISAAAIKAIQNCDVASQLFLIGCNLEPNSLAELAELERLQELDLSNSSVQDPQLKNLQTLDQLVLLRLSGTRITDVGLGHLTALPKLKQLDLTNTQVTDRGIAGFRSARPDVTIEK